MKNNIQKQIDRIKNDYFAFLGELKDINDEILKYIFGKEILIDREYDVKNEVLYIISIKIIVSSGFYILLEIENLDFGYKNLDICYFDNNKYKKDNYLPPKHL